MKMINNAIKVETVAAEKIEQFVVPPAVVHGWLVFARVSSTSNWTIAYPSDTGPNYDYYRHPYPLCSTRENAIEAGSRYLTNGGEIRLIEVKFGD